MFASLTVRKVSEVTHTTKEYILVSIYFSKTSDSNKSVLIKIVREIHIIENLKANMLIENDVLDSEEFVLDVSNKSVYIKSCNIIIELKIRSRETFFRKNVVVESIITISSRQEQRISVNMSLSEDRDFLFTFFKNAIVTLYYHLVNAKTTMIIARNESEEIKKLSAKYKLEDVSEINYDKCFRISKLDLTTKSSKKSRIEKTATSQIQLITIMSKRIRSALIINLADKRHEITLSNDVMIFEHVKEIKAYTTLVMKFLSL
jgi:hypothetical protein